jgi:hypothetical protein
VCSRCVVPSRFHFRGANRVCKSPLFSLSRARFTWTLPLNSALLSRMKLRPRRFWCDICSGRQDMEMNELDSSVQEARIILNSYERRCSFSCYPKYCFAFGALDSFCFQIDHFLLLELETFKRDAKYFDRRQSSKSTHKNSMINGFGKTRI